MKPFFSGTSGVLGFTAFICALASLHADTSLTIGTIPGYPGTTVTVPVAVREAANSVALQFDMAFDANRVAALTPLRGERLTNHVLRSRRLASGVERVLLYSLTNAAIAFSNASVASLPFAVPATEYVGSGPLILTNVVLARREGTALAPVQANAGAIFVRPVNRRPDGVVDFFLPSQPDERYLIQATTNFVQWELLSTNLALGDFLQLVDLDAPHHPHRFYRSAVFDALVGGTLGEFGFQTNGVVGFRLTGLPDRSYAVEASTNLTTWTLLATLPTTNGTFLFVDADLADYSQRFYRARLVP